MRSIERLLPRIGHIQIADNPGRHEPGTGEIAFDNLLAASMRSVTTGFIGCEYMPAGDARGARLGAALPGTWTRSPSMGGDQPSLIDTRRAKRLQSAA